MDGEKIRYFLMSISDREGLVMAMCETDAGSHALSEAYRYHDDTIALRRWFHTYPESSLKEYQTSARIRDELSALGIPHRTAGETGVVGIIQGTAPGAEGGPVIGLRADIDALEIREQNDVAYRSVHDGLMHACGHDGHTASLLTASRILQQGRAGIPGTVKLIFQPAEEIGRGAKIIVDSGLVSDVNAFFGIHVTPNLPTGQISVVSGPIMAGSNTLRIEVHGKSGHGAKPHQAIDAIAAGCAIVEALQHVVSREIDPVDPAVVTIGTFNAGTRENIIANKAVLTGTLRVLTEETRRQASEAIKRIVINIAAAHRVDVDVQCEHTTSIVINDASLYDIVLKSVGSILSEQAIARLPVEMGTEDFPVYGAVAPAFYAHVGVGGCPGLIKNYPVHHEKFNLDEDSLAIAAALHVEFARQYLGY